MTRQTKNLFKARQRTEKKLRELELKIEHLYWRLDERRCVVKRCPLDGTGEDVLDDYAMESDE